MELTMLYINSMANRYRSINPRTKHLNTLNACDCRRLMFKISRVELCSS